MDESHNTNEDTYKRDLPALRIDDRDLPLLAAGAKPHHEQASKVHSEWFNLTSHQHVRDLAVDPTQGDVWLATGGGILRWRQDLDRFTRYASEHGLPGNSAATVAVDGSGRVWAIAPAGVPNPAMPPGLFYLDGDAWRSYLPLGGLIACCLSVDDAGSLWVGSAGGVYAIGVDNVGNGELHSDLAGEFSLPLPPGHLPRMMKVTDESDIWLCNARGLYHFDGDGWACFHQHPGILAVLRQSQHLWMGMIDGLVRIDLSDGKPHRSDNWPSGEVNALAPADSGVWVACQGRVGLITETDWTPIKKQWRRLQITRLAPAGDSEVWIGTHSGLLRGDPTGMRFHLTNAPPDVIGLSLPERPPDTFSNMVQALAMQKLEDKSVLWIGTPRGLFCLDLLADIWKRYLQRGLRDVQALIIGDAQEDIWVASWNDGLRSIKKQAVLECCPNVRGPVLALTSGISANCWAAGLDGLYQWDGATWTLIVSANRFSASGLVRAVAQVQADRVWIGTSVGLFAYEPDTDTLTKSGGVLGSADVRSLLAILDDDSEQLWVGTGRGLYCGRPDDLGLVSGLGGLPVNALAWDSRAETLWAGTDNGLFRLVYTADAWETVSQFTAQDSGLAANLIITFALDVDESGAAILWIGTPCGLSCHTY